MELTGKQKRFLRKLGRDLPTTVAAGKAGLSAAVVAQADRVLSSRELVKVRVPAGPRPQREQMGRELAESLAAVCVEVLGRTVLLYRPGNRPDAEERIRLP